MPVTQFLEGCYAICYAVGELMDVSGRSNTLQICYAIESENKRFGTGLRTCYDSEFLKYLNLIKSPILVDF